MDVRVRWGLGSRAARSGCMHVGATELKRPACLPDELQLARPVMDQFKLLGFKLVGTPIQYVQFSQLRSDTVHRSIVASMSLMHMQGERLIILVSLSGVS